MNTKEINFNHIRCCSLHINLCWNSWNKTNHFLRAGNSWSRVYILNFSVYYSKARIESLYFDRFDVYCPTLGECPGNSGLLNQEISLPEHIFLVKSLELNLRMIHEENKDTFPNSTMPVSMPSRWCESPFQEFTRVIEPKHVVIVFNIVLIQ